MDRSTIRAPLAAATHWTKSFPACTSSLAIALPSRGCSSSGTAFGRGFLRLSLDGSQVSFIPAEAKLAMRNRAQPHSKPNNAIKDRSNCRAAEIDFLRHGAHHAAAFSLRTSPLVPGDFCHGAGAKRLDNHGDARSPLANRASTTQIVFLLKNSEKSYGVGFLGAPVHCGVQLCA